MHHTNHNKFIRPPSLPDTCLHKQLYRVTMQYSVELASAARAEFASNDPSFYVTAFKLHKPLWVCESILQSFSIYVTSMSHLTRHISWRHVFLQHLKGHSIQSEPFYTASDLVLNVGRSPSHNSTFDNTRAMSQPLPLPKGRFLEPCP